MASLLLSNGKYLHTAYAVSNIAEEFTNDDWSLSSQEGFGYIGQYIDDSAVDSSDPTDYVWTEFLDEDVDDLDDEGDMPMADFQSQIDALQDQIEVLQGDAENLQSSIEVNASNVADSAQLASEAADIANATGQYFWHDANGAHVSTEENNPEGERNSIWNSLGMLFRKGATNLLAVLAGGASGTDPKGIAVYDGEGNDAENVVASFTDSGSVIGKQNDGQLLLKNNYLRILNKEGNNVFSVENIQTTTQGIGFDVFVRREDEKNIGTYTHTIPDYLGDLGVHIYFTKTGSGSVSDIIALENFGNWSINSTSPNFQASGSVSFNANTNTLTVTVTSVSDNEFYLDLACGYDTYVRYPQIKIKPDSTVTGFSTTHKVFVIDDIDDSENFFWIKDNGELWSINNITAANLTGSQTADYTGSYTMGNCTILTGSVTINVTTANTNTDKAVTFGPTFKHTPCVQCTMLNIGGSYYQRVTAAGPSTTGFTARIRAGGTPGNVIVNWVAIGELA